MPPKPLLVLVALSAVGAATLATVRAEGPGELRPLRIVRVNPSGEEVVAGAQIVFQFDRPVVPLGRMARDGAEIPIQITPDPGCEWRWLDRSALACQLAEARPLRPATRYRIVVRPGLRAEDGTTLAEPLEHTFLTQRPRVVHSWFETWTSPGTPVIRLTFDQPVTRESVESALDFGSSDHPSVPVAVEPVSPAGRAWRVRPVSELPGEVTSGLRVSPGLRSPDGTEPGVEERTIVAFRTFPEPRFVGVDCLGPENHRTFLAAGAPPDPSRGCDPLSAVWVVFSSPLIKEVLRDHLTVTPDLAGGRDDYDPWESVSSRSHLSRRPPLEHRYGVRLPEVLQAAAAYRLRGDAQGLRDEFDRPLVADLDFSFFTDHRRPRLHLDHRASVMESGVDSHLPVVVTNLESIEASFARLGVSDLETGRAETISVPAVEDVAFRFPLRVRDWLDGDSGALAGHVRARPRVSDRVGGGSRAAAGRSRAPTRHGGEWFFSQVTPFHVHLKLGHYGSLAWVTDLATGEPVTGAEVELETRIYETLRPTPGPTARSSTDADGVARLPGIEEIDPGLELSRRWKRRDDPHLIVRVRKDGEVAVLPAASDFLVDSRSAGNLWLPVDPQRKFGHLRAWGFTAQGVYRAGDRVDYKIYVRQEGNRRLLPAPAKPYELRVVDPMGKTVHERGELELSRFGAVDGAFHIPETGAVGWYRFELEAGFGEQLVRYPLQMLVSDFTPAPFRVSTDLNGELFRSGDEVEVATRAALHSGGPYADAATRVTAALEPRPFRPSEPSVRGFFFESGSQSRQVIFSGDAQLDGDGKLATSFPLVAPSILYGELSVESAVRDDRGKRIAGGATARYAGRDRYVGIRQADWILEAGEPAEVETVVTDVTGRPLPGVPVLVRIEHRKTKASRVKGAGNAYLTRYIQSWEEAARCERISAPGPVGCRFTPEHAGSYKLIASIRDAQGRPVDSSLWRWAAGKGRVLWEEPPGHHLQVLPEKETVRVGETARYLVQNPFPGARALVTVERYGVIDSWVETLADSSAVVEVPIEPDYLPGFYLSVVVAAPRAAPPPAADAVDLGKPAFRIGYARTRVKDPYKELVVEVTPRSEAYKPRQEAVVELRALTRRGETAEVELAVAVLDEAVLDLLAGGAALYDPHRGFYDLSGLDLVNYNLLKRLLGWQAFEKKGANPGGGGGPDPTLRSLFKFVSYWNPSIRPDAEGRATIRFELPDNLTAWRVLAVAVTPEDELGLGQGSFRVNRPTEIRPALPNQVVEGDRFEARFTVMNRTERHRRLTVTGGAAGAVEGAPEMRSVVEAEPFRRYPVSLLLAAAEPGEIVLRVEAGDEEDRDALRLAVPVHRRQALEAAATYGSTTDNETIESILFPPGMRTDVGRVSLVAAPTVIGNLEGAFDYIRHYPYLCWEQRLTKGVMAAHFKALRGYLDETLEWPDAEALPAATLESAANFQAPNGGMSYWVPRDDYVSPYLSAYTALAFGWLRDLGHPPPSGVEEKLHEYLRTMLRKDVLPDFYSPGMASSVRAVALAALARSGKASLIDLARYREHAPRMDLFGQAHYLQALGRVSGTDEVRREVTDRILSHAVESGGKLVLNESLDDGYARILSSELRTRCAVLTALAEQGQGELTRAGASSLPFKLVRGITQSRGSRDHWENTQENLFCTRALIDYSRAWERTLPRFTVRASLDDEELGSARFDDLRDEPVELERPIAADDPGRSARLRIERLGEGRLYYGLRLFYSPSTLERRLIDAGIEVRREYSVERQEGWVRLDDPLLLRRGELVRIDLYVTAPTARNFVVVDDPVPGGLEPVNRDLATASKVDGAKAVDVYPPDAWYRRYDDWIYFGWSRWSFYHRELRHDAARFYADYLPAGRYHLSYVAQVIVPGEFVALPTRAEEMYDPDVFGRGMPATVRVEDVVEPEPAAAAEEGSR